MDLIDPAALAFDVDGVVADTMSLFLAIARNKHGVEGIAKEDITCYMLEECLPIESDVILDVIEDILNGSHKEPLHPQEGAPDVLGRLVQLTEPLVFVTARSVKPPVQGWLERTLGVNGGRIRVTATGSFEAKVDVLKEYGRTCFVEDRLETCFLLAEAGVTPIVFRQPWNREPHPFMEVGSWEELAVNIRGL